MFLRREDKVKKSYLEFRGGLLRFLVSLASVKSFATHLDAVNLPRLFRKGGLWPYFICTQDVTVCLSTDETSKKE